jgi:threonine/homoserine/homoserine lactone efflux protein
MTPEVSGPVGPGLIGAHPIQAPSGMQLSGALQGGTAMSGFVPDLSVILAFALAAFIIAITPGPDMALQMSRSINHGFWHGIACGLGAMSGIVVHTTLAAFGISVLIVAAPPLFLALKIAGAVYLLWLAWQAITKGGGIRLAAAGKREPTLWQSYATGIGINLLNP